MRDAGVFYPKVIVNKHCDSVYSKKMFTMTFSGCYCEYLCLCRNALNNRKMATTILLLSPLIF